MFRSILGYIKNEWATMPEILEAFGLEHSAGLRAEFVEYNKDYDPDLRPFYVASSNANGYILTDDPKIIRESAENHLRLALNHLTKYWAIVKKHETKDNLKLDIEKAIGEKLEKEEDKYYLDEAVRLLRFFEEYRIRDGSSAVSIFDKETERDILLVYKSDGLVQVDQTKVDRLNPVSKEKLRDIVREIKNSIKTEKEKGK